MTKRTIHLLRALKFPPDKVCRAFPDAAALANLEEQNTPG